jgi:hypothetical protein
MGRFGALWGIAGFSLLLGYAIIRLAPIAIDAFSHPFLWYHWLALILNTLLMAYSEGYRGFQQGLSPRVAARARYLYHHPNSLHALLSPLFCMGYFYTTKRRQVATISLTIGIIILILLVRLLGQPWRGIIDVGVIIGLSWGLVSLMIFTIKAFTTQHFDFSPELPDQDYIIS